MENPDTEDFRKALSQHLAKAMVKGAPFVEVLAGGLHREIGGQTVALAVGTIASGQDFGNLSVVEIGADRAGTEGSAVSFTSARAQALSKRALINAAWSVFFCATSAWCRPKSAQPDSRLCRRSSQ